MRAWTVAVLLFGLTSLACSPTIGDSCTSDLSCSLNADRQCDLTVRNGQCTIFGCEADSCPDGAVCVRFRPDPSRLAFTACMRPCDGGGCRRGAGFVCTNEDDPVLDDFRPGEQFEMLDISPPEQAFCVALRNND